MAESEKIRVVTLGWGQTEASEPGERPNAQLHSRIFLGDREIQCAKGITIRARGGDFVEADIHVNVAEIEFVPVDYETFQRDNPFPAR